MTLCLGTNNPKVRLFGVHIKNRKSSICEELLEINTLLCCLSTHFSHKPRFRIHFVGFHVVFQVKMLQKSTTNFGKQKKLKNICIRHQATVGPFNTESHCDYFCLLRTQHKSTTRQFYLVSFVVGHGMWMTLHLTKQSSNAQGSGSLNMHHARSMRNQDTHMPFSPF